MREAKHDKAYFENRYKFFKVQSGKVGDHEITIVDIKKDEKTYDCSVRLTFSDSVVYEGDMGFFIFQGNINKPRTFFCGTLANYDYWHQKLECASGQHYDRTVDQDLALNHIKEFLKHNCAIEEGSDEYNEIDDYFYTVDSDSVNDWAERWIEFNSHNDISMEPLECYSEINDCCHEDGRYIYACDLLQWASNKMQEMEKEAV